MSQKFKNSRQKAQTNSGSIIKLFNVLVLNFCHNLKGSCQFCLLAAQKFCSKGAAILTKFYLLLRQNWSGCKIRIINTNQL